MVDFLADDVERAVELDVDLAAVGLGDLDLVVAVLVALLGLGDLAAAGGLQRRRARAVQGGARDGLIVAVVAAVAGVGAAAAGRTGHRRAAGRQRRDDAGHDQHTLELVLHHVSPSMGCEATYARELGSPLDGNRSTTRAPSPSWATPPCASAIARTI